MWSRESPVWLWTALLGLLLVALVAGAIAALAATDDEPRPRARAGPTTSVLNEPTTIPTLPGTVAIPPPTTNQITTATGTTATTATTTTGTTGTTGNTTAVIRWPTGRRGYTVVLASIPTSRGRSAAEAKAREAIGKGLDDVGVLNSADYTSLRAGYYVVFTGVHDTLAEARGAVPEAESAGYDTAYVREIRP